MTTSTRTDELQKQRDKEFAQRAADATQCAQLLSQLLLGERLTTGPESHVLAVPNGWIFYENHKAGITSTFVPQPPKRAQSFAEKIQIP